jgi:hypothetical protein
MRLILFFLLSAIGVTYAQLPKDFDMAKDQFILLSNNSFLLEGQFTYEKGFWGERFYNGQGLKIPKHRIWFYNVGKGTYANSGRGEMLKLRFPGHYNIYSGRGFLDEMVNNEAEIFSSLHGYFINQGFEELELVTYRLLQKKLRVFPDDFDPDTKVSVIGILDNMKKRRRNRNTATYVSIISMGVSIVSLTSYLENRYKPLRDLAIASFCISIGSSMSLFILPRSRRLHLKALQAYNSGF